MTWTKEMPTVPGWYAMPIYEYRLHKPVRVRVETVEVRSLRTGLRIYEADGTPGEWLDEYSYRGYWLGPIPTPPR